MSKRNREKRSVSVGNAIGKKMLLFGLGKQKSKTPEVIDTVGDNLEMISIILDLLVAFMTTVLYAWAALLPSCEFYKLSMTSFCQYRVKIEGFSSNGEFSCGCLISIFVIGMEQPGHHTRASPEPEMPVKVTYIIIWRAPRAGKMNKIARCDWLHERAPARDYPLFPASKISPKAI